jgi:hypothetical protein
MIYVSGEYTCRHCGFFIARVAPLGVILREKPCNFVLYSIPQCCSNASLGVQWYKDVA